MDMDEKRKKLVEAKNGLENYLYSVKSSLNDELKTKLGDDSDVVESNLPYSATPHSLQD